MNAFKPPINIRQKLFAEHILKGTNATDAYILADYRITSRPSAQAAAARLRRNPKFAAYYEKLQRQADAKSRRRTKAAIRRKLRTLDRIIHGDSEGSTGSPQFFQGTKLVSASRSSHHNTALIRHQKTNRYGGRVVHLPCKLTAIHQYLELTGHLDLTETRA